MRRKIEQSGNFPNLTHEPAIEIICAKHGKKSVLNLGRGNLFKFERSLLKRDDNCDIVSVDVQHMRKIPKRIKFVRQNVEAPFNLGKKFNFVTFFELIEHIDKTDVLLDNCKRHLELEGRLIISFPNLASIWGRIELLLGYQPHILEISNKYANFGTGIFGRTNNPGNKSIHHIRGITYCAMKAFLERNGFVIEKERGYSHKISVLGLIPSIAPVVIFSCKLKKNERCSNRNRV